MTKLEFRELVEETIGHGELGLLLVALWDEFNELNPFSETEQLRELEPQDVARFADIISTHLELED